MRQLMVLFLVATTGCTYTYEPKSITDIPPEERPWLRDFTLSAKGDDLIIKITPDLNKPMELLVADVTAEAYDGELYLSAYRLSHRARAQRFVIDTTKFELRQPWREHVYWQTGGWYENGIADLTYRGPLDQHVGRTRMSVADAAP